MKSIKIVFMCIILALLSVSFLACSSPESDPREGDDESEGGNSPVHAITIQEYIDKNYSVETKKDLVAVEYENNQYILTYRIGKIKKALLGIISPMASSKGCTITVTQEKITESTTTEIHMNHFGGAISTSTRFGIPLFAEGKFEIEVNYEHEWGKETSETQGLMDGFSISYDLSKYEDGVYAIALFNDLSVYQSFYYNQTTSQAVPTNEPLIIMATSQSYHDVYKMSSADELSEDFEPNYSSTIGNLNAFTFSKESLFSQGNGTDSDPYIISGKGQISAIGLMPNKSYLLGRDIDYFGWTFEQAVVNINFTGTFNGSNYAIKNLYIERTGTSISVSDIYLGFFKSNSGIVKNIRFENCNVNVSSAHGGDKWIYAGILAGMQSGTMSSIMITGGKVEVHRSKSAIGGVAGMTGTSSLIEDCTINSISIKGNGDEGGYLGQASSGTIIKKCSISNSTISHYSINEKRSIGGFIGYSLGRIENCKIKLVSFTLEQFTKAPAVGILIGTLEKGGIFSCVIDDISMTWIDYAFTESLFPMYYCSSFIFNFGNNGSKHDYVVGNATGTSGKDWEIKLI